MFTRIKDQKIETSGKYRIKARAFTNEYVAYDDIGCSTRLYKKRKNFLGRTRWRTARASAPITVRAFYVINAEDGKSVVVSEAKRYQRDNYVSVRAPRVGVQIGGTIGEIFDPNQYRFDINAHYLDWSYVREQDWDTLARAFQESAPRGSNIPGIPERTRSSVRMPISISFPKDKARQFDGVIGFHAARAGGHEFRRKTEHNIKSNLVIPPEFVDRFGFHTPWLSSVPAG